MDDYICKIATLDEMNIKWNYEIEHNIDDKTIYLCAFRTIEEYQGKGYFSKLMKYMLNDLKNKGYKKVTLGIEPKEEKNKKIYEHFGFNKYIKSGIEEYPDGTKIDVIYYAKNL